MPLKLANGCWASDFNVISENWEKAGASIKKDWQIQYYFHDPAFENHPTWKKRGYQVRIKNGINRYKTLAQRREAVQHMIREETALLVDEGYNPYTKTYATPNDPVPTGPVSEDTPLQSAIMFALRKRWKEYRPATAKEVFRYLRRLRVAAKGLDLHQKRIADFKRRDLLSILDEHARLNRPWTVATWNNCLGYIRPLFRILMQYDAIESNPLDLIDNKQKDKTKRLATTDEQRAEIDAHLQKVDRHFWRLVNIFWDSGAREIELLGVQAKDVDLVRQTFWITVYKGRSGTSERVLKPIVNTALPHWAAVLEGAEPEDYVFGVKRASTRERWYDFAPMPKPATRDVVTRRWAMWVKAPVEAGGLGIPADMYSLKHSRTTKLAALNEQAGADFNGHSSKEMNMKHYDLMAEDRKRDALKEVVIPFGAAQQAA